MTAENKKNIVSRLSGDENHVISCVDLNTFVHGEEEFQNKEPMVEEIEHFLASQRVPDDRRARLAVEIRDLIVKARDEVVAPRVDVVIEGRERWKRADGKRRRDESPVAFVKRIYPDRQALGLTMPDIKRVDPELYMALAQWKTRHPDDPELATLHLPTRKQKNDELLAVLGAPSGADVFAMMRAGDPRAKQIARLERAAARRGL